MDESEVVRSAAYQHAYKMARDFGDVRTEKLDAMRSHLSWLAKELAEYQPFDHERETFAYVSGFIDGLADGCAERAY